jgi:phage/conjugal plasmid C-4 type zinc finger TraR family protein
MYSYSANRTGDQADAASRVEMRLNALRLKAARAQMEGEGRAECQDCGEAIDSRRRQLVPNAVRCTGCQNMHEALKKIGGYASRVPRSEPATSFEETPSRAPLSPDSTAETTDSLAIREVEVDLGISSFESLE